MCNISKETILRANRRVSDNARSSYRNANGDFVVATQYRGRTYSQTISLNTIRENYGKALENYGKRV